MNSRKPCATESGCTLSFGSYPYRADTHPNAAATIALLSVVISPARP